MTRRLLATLAVLWWVAALAGAVAASGRGLALWGPLLVTPGYGTVGAFLAARRPRNPIGWLFLGLASMPLLAVTIGPPAEVQNGLVVAGLALTLVIFPTGAPPGGIWYLPMGVTVVSWVVGPSLGAITLADNFSLPVGVVLAVASLLVCIAAPIVRFRSARGIERAQLRWLGVAAGLTIVGGVVLGAGLAASNDALFGLGGVVGGLGVVVAVPAAILVAVLRYRLYELDRIVSRTVTYGAVAIVVSLVYTVPVLLIPQVVDGGGDLVVATATLAAAIAFDPARRRIRRVVDRRFNRSAYDAAGELDRLAADLRDRVRREEIQDRLATAAGSILEPASISVWLRN